MTQQNSGDVQQKHEQTIADYVGDMVAMVAKAWKTAES
jgi:hypothetical protein